MRDARLIGAWRLVSYEQHGADGRVQLPLGPEPRGMLIYTADGYVSVQMMAGERPRLPGGDVGQGSTEDKAAALETYRAYCGSYEVTGDRVTHHVAISSWPNRVGTDLVRFFTFQDGRLLLRSAPFAVEGIAQVAYLAWEPAAGEVVQC